MSAFDYAAAPTLEQLADQPMNDLGNAMRLILTIGGRIESDGGVNTDRCTLLFLLGLGWIGFNGRFWDREFGEELARKTAHRVARELGGQFKLLVEKGATNKDVMKFITNAGSAGQTSAMLRQAQSYLTVKIDAFDQDPMAINVRNGTVKMRWRPEAPEGQRFEVVLAQHDPADRITRMAAAEWRPDAAAPLYLSTLRSSLPDEQERGAFHRMMGYSATGRSEEQAFFFNQGPGQDGKSTLLDACRETLGTYAVAAKPETFLEGPQMGGSGPQPDLIALAGDTRLAIVSEPPRGAKLKEGLLKAWTSGSPISARDLQAKPINFRPVTKLVWEMNSFVVAKGDDDGIWRRIKPVLFRKKVPDDKVDRRLPEKLRGEADGILAWLIEGVGAWLERGLDWPSSLKAVVDDYRKASSPFGDWLTERCVYGEAANGARTLSGDLHADYKEWCEAQGNDKPMSARAFGDALRDRQIALAGKDPKGRKFRGPIRLKTPLELDQDTRAAEAAAGRDAPPGDQELPRVGDPLGGDAFAHLDEPEWDPEA
jgi:putative DNA primase/helicase